MSRLLIALVVLAVVAVVAGVAVPGDDHDLIPAATKVVTGDSILKELSPPNVVLLVSDFFYSFLLLALLPLLRLHLVF
jgi:hypothetical protein